MRDLPIVEFTINGEPFEDTGPQDVQIYPDNIDGEMIVQGERRLKWGDVESRKQADLTELKNDLSVISALVGARERDNMTTGGIKITERKVEECVHTSAEYKEHLKKIIQAQLQLDFAKHRRLSMDHRRDMLVGMAANYRAEGNADPVILREEARRKSYEREKSKAEERVNLKKAAQEVAAAAVEKSNKKPPGKRPPGRRPPGKPATA